MKIIQINGEIGYEVTADSVRKELPQGQEAIRLDINSPGGDVFEAFAITNLLKEYKGKVTARILGIAASAAADIWLSADAREYFAKSAFMNHRAWGFTVGNADDMQAQASILSALDDVRVADYAKLTGKTKEAALADYSAEVWLIGADSLKTSGIEARQIDDEENPEEEITEAKARLLVVAAMEKVKCKRDANGRATLQSIASVAALLKTETEKKQEDAIVKTFADFLKENPSAEIEAIEFAKAKLGDPAAAAKAEGERIANILALGGVKLSDETKKAIEANTDPAEFAKAELVRVRATLGTENNPPTLGSVKQLGQEKTEDKKEASDKPNAMKSALGWN